MAYTDAELVYKGDASYALVMEGEHTVITTRGDKDGRGAEYSALEVFCGKLLTMDDRTGERFAPEHAHSRRCAFAHSTRMP